VKMEIRIRTEFDPESRINLMLGDVNDMLDKIPDNSVDLILTDPPYMISQDGGKITRNNMRFGAYKRSMDISLDYGEWDHFETIEDYIAFTDNWVTKSFSKLKEGGWIFIFFDKMKMHILQEIADRIGITPKLIYTWCKTNPAPHFRKMNFVSATELIWCGEKGNKKMKNYQPQREMYNYFLSPNKTAYGETDHPNEKPVELLKKLILPTTLKDDVVLDPFMGSGSTGVAAIMLDRKFVGIEKEQHYVEQAISRIAKHTGIHKFDLFDHDLSEQVLE